MDSRGLSAHEATTVFQPSNDNPITSQSATSISNLSSNSPHEALNQNPPNTSKPLSKTQSYSRNTNKNERSEPQAENGQNGSHAYTTTDLPTQLDQTALAYAGQDDGNPVSTLNVPQIQIQEATTPNSRAEDKQWQSSEPSKSRVTDVAASPSSDQFHGITLDISSSGLSDDIGTNNMKFSNRGSMLIDGKRLNGNTYKNATSAAPALPAIEEPAPTLSRTRTTRSVSDQVVPRTMSTDEQELSEKVRSFYVAGSDAIPELESESALSKGMNLRWQDAVPHDSASMLTVSRATSMTEIGRPSRSPSIRREDNELAGGLEDWQDVDNADVDRYGFIIPKSPTSSTTGGGVKRSPTASGNGLQRVSSALQLASESPRRKRTIRRAPSKSNPPQPDQLLTQLPPSQPTSRPSSTRSASIHRNQSASRSLTNRFPHNKDRRLMDEAADMLTLPRSATDNISVHRSVREESQSTTYTPAPTAQSRRKEAEREEKWRKMARSVPVSTRTAGTVGGGMAFTFDTTNAKLIERTWKGIPDTWRATAWHAFLSTSVQKHNRKPRNRNNQLPSDDELAILFHEYQTHNSPDDVQIDIDVPRTISSHIMFRRRYRGGQRLLFRVLHAMSMHFADTGYVQGMAALAASLLAYYEEEKAFIMLVRLWELRGLEKLYRHGFGGLMEALDDFETKWLGQGEVKARLDNMGIGPTAYGTRWYLTLFNYSIPFAAQLRVWDVFMLFDHDDDDNDDNDGGVAASVPAGKPDRPFGTTLDVLHATSAALIDGMRDILMDADFETAMKVLTSWVPIRDEDLFMRVARAEWKVHKAATTGRK